jgi:hypothetical protein
MLLTKSSKHTIQQRLRLVSAVVVATVASTGFASAQTKFVIQSFWSGKALDGVILTPFPHQNIILQLPITWQPDQQWGIRRVANRYQIASFLTGQVLEGYSAVHGTPIDQSPADGGTYQQWTIKLTPGSIGFEIISANVERIPCGGFFPCFANLALDVTSYSKADGAVIQQWTENDGWNQQWIFNPIDDTSLPWVHKNIVAAANGTTVTASGWNFQPFSQVCPVFGLSRGAVPGPCTTVDSNGSFSVAITSLSDSNGLYQFDSTGTAQTVVTAEDTSGNVLAIGRIHGTWNQVIN